MQVNIELTEKDIERIIYEHYWSILKEVSEKDKIMFEILVEDGTYEFLTAWKKLNGKLIFVIKSELREPK